MLNRTNTLKQLQNSTQEIPKDPSHALPTIPTKLPLVIKRPPPPPPPPVGALPNKEKVIGDYILHGMDVKENDRIIMTIDPQTRPGQSHIIFDANINANINANNKNSSIHFTIYKLATNSSTIMFHNMINKNGNNKLHNEIKMETTGNPVYILIIYWGLQGSDKITLNNLEFKLSDSLLQPAGKSKFGASDSNKKIIYAVIALIVLFIAYKIYKKKKYGFGKRRR